jgi:argininosuccinate synthase
VLEDPWIEPPEDIFTLTKSPAAAPDTAAYLELTFEAGVPSRSTACRCRSPS